MEGSATEGKLHSSLVLSEHYHFMVTFPIGSFKMCAFRKGKLDIRAGEEREHARHNEGNWNHSGVEENRGGPGFISEALPLILTHHRYGHQLPALCNSKRPCVFSQSDFREAMLVVTQQMQWRLKICSKQLSNKLQEIRTWWDICKQICKL